MVAEDDRRVTSTRSLLWFYGGKGVTVCGEWRDAMTGFPAFVAWAKDQGYEPGLWIDRIDPDTDYQPANCRSLHAKTYCAPDEYLTTKTRTG
jgi:hypothetical protein